MPGRKKTKTMRRGGGPMKTKTMRRGGGAAGMTVAQLRAAAKKKGFKLVKA